MNTLKDVLNTRQSGYSWHMPGHKGKAIWNLNWEQDVTELEDTDNLQHPESCIAATETAIAKKHGAYKSFLSVSGSSGMILAMLDAACRPGDTILAVKSAHKSFFNGCIHTDLRPVYLLPEVFTPWGFTGGVTLDTVKEAVEQHPGAKALFVTNPTYEGYWYDLSEIAEYLHMKGKLLLVDEAHGAHVSYIGGYPKTALEMGADMVVQSYHKTLPSPTQTAVLHLGSERVSAARVRESINAYQTTSPSYWLMKGLDCCRAYMESLDQDTIQNYWNLVQRFRKQLESIPEVEVFPSVDPSKIVFRIVYDQKIIRSQWLYQQLQLLGQEPEGVFGDAVMLISTIMDTKEAFECLIEAIRSIIERWIPENARKNCEIFKKQFETVRNCDIIKQPDTVMSLREAYYADKETIELMKAHGRIAASFITPYPPGVPVLCPGERISQESIDMLKRSIVNGIEILGLSEDQLITVIQKKEEDQ